jgi:hypothetical protein
MEHTNGTRSIAELVELLHDFALILPKRQREFVWSKAKRMKLIDSVLQGMPVGSAFVHQQEGRPEELDDAGQRLVTLYSYMTPHIDDKFLGTLSTKDGKHPSKWAKMPDKSTGFVPFEKLELEQKNKIRRTQMSVIYFKGGDSEADEMFRRLQLGDSLNAGQKLHARTAATWYASLELVEKALTSFTNRSRKTMIAGHSLAIAVSDDTRVLHNDTVIQDVLDNANPEVFEEATCRAIKTLAACTKLDEQLKDKGAFYGSWDIATRYRILYNLLEPLEINKNNANDLYLPLLKEMVQRLDDPKSTLSTTLATALNGRRTVDFSLDGYQKMFYPVREILLGVKTIGPRDKNRRFTTEQRQELFDNAHGACEVCGCPLVGDWDAHHVVYHGHGGLTAVENGQALCNACHTDAHALGVSGDRYTKTTVELAKVVVV